MYVISFLFIPVIKLPIRRQVNLLVLFWFLTPNYVVKIMNVSVMCFKLIKCLSVQSFDNKILNRLNRIEYWNDLLKNCQGIKLLSSCNSYSTGQKSSNYSKSTEQNRQLTFKPHAKTGHRQTKKKKKKKPRLNTHSSHRTRNNPAPKNWTRRISLYPPSSSAARKQPTNNLFRNLTYITGPGGARTTTGGVTSGADRVQHTRNVSLLGGARTGALYVYVVYVCAPCVLCGTRLLRTEAAAAGRPHAGRRWSGADATRPRLPTPPGGGATCGSGATRAARRRGAAAVSSFFPGGGGSATAGRPAEGTRCCWKTCLGGFWFVFGVCFFFFFFFFCWRF